VKKRGFHKTPLGICGRMYTPPPPFLRAEISYKMAGFDRYGILIVCYLISYSRRKMRK